MFSEAPQGHSPFRSIFSRWLCLVGGQQQSPETFPNDSRQLPSFQFSGSCWRSEAQCSTVGGTREGRSCQEGGLAPCKPSAGFLLCLLPPIPACLISTCREANTLSIYFISAALGVPITSGQRAHDLETIKRCKTGIGNDWQFLKISNKMLV